MNGGQLENHEKDHSTFDAFVAGKESLVEFYAPWCGHCKKLRPEYDLAADQLKDEGIQIAKIDCDAEINKEICGKYEIEGFPTLKIFENGEVKSDYSGPLESLAIVQKMLHIPRSEEIPSEQGKMLKIVGKTFNELVFESEKHVLVKFYAPWCPHCKNMAPTWVEFAEQNENDALVIGDIDVTANEIEFESYKDLVQGFPTVLLFKNGEKTAPIKYQGDRSLEDFKKFIASSLE
ncbi:Oidioi.mRNA.OKI2018_I69.chr2.g5248.t1.cds [Oikopleura dioica]|uniref:Oidioi.mRNA.OKI2018_I69.chr2.g5248.t1.cds n=1 Tax=Oikopleura dioica TaxID=34765 RepID=A0ABN7T5F4_OIKDI|nr:Oidioi.mRNA.OKI2018_I69.chr2.g5248.t1.cds [Oikopleura dioica]